MKILAGIALLGFMVPAMAGASLFTQDFSSSSTVADYTSATPGTNKFNSIGATAPDAWSITGGALQLTKGGAVASTINRTTALDAAPLTLFSFQFDVGFAFTGAAANTALGFFELDAIGGANWGTFGFQVDSTGADNTWRVSDGSGGFTGVKTVKVYVNDTGSNATYTDPLGAQRTISDTYIDIWVGNTLARSKPVQNLNTANDINAFRFVSPANNGITNGTLTLDNFLIEAIPKP